MAQLRNNIDNSVTRTGIINSRRTLTDIDNHIYTPEEIEAFQMDDAINQHPLARRPMNIRSKLAYAEIMKNLKPTPKYLLPGQIVCFEYLEPKLKEDLEYYDRMPLTLFFGIIRTNEGVIREIGLNLHYYPPHTRARVLRRTYQVFKPYFDKYFNDASKKPNTIMFKLSVAPLVNIISSLRLAFIKFLIVSLAKSISSSTLNAIL